MGERQGASGPFARQLAVIGLAAFALRLAVRALAGTAAFWQDGYTIFADLALSLSQGHGYAFPGQPPTAFRVPLYPIVIALTSGGDGANPWPLIVAQALASTGTVACAALLAQRRFGDRAGLLAGVLCALYPYYVWHDLSLQETGLFTFLAALATFLLCSARDCASRGQAMLAGGVLGLAILTRATLLPFALIGCLWLALPDRASATPPARRFSSAGLAFAALLLVLSPWLVRAHAITGRYGLGTEFGAAVYAGNHPLTFADYPDRSIDLSRAKVFQAIPADERARLDTMGEAAQSDWYLRKGGSLDRSTSRRVRARRTAKAVGGLPPLAQPPPWLDRRPRLCGCLVPASAAGTGRPLAGTAQLAARPADLRALAHLRGHYGRPLGPY